MSVIVLDPRFPGMVPVESVTMLGNDVCYTDEVPVNIRWFIADLGGHVVDDTEIIITTDPFNEIIQERIGNGERVFTAPSLVFQRTPIAIEEPGASYLEWEHAGYEFEMKEIPSGSASKWTESTVIDGEVIAKTDVPSDVLHDLEEAIALMARALRQGEWEQEQTHASLLKHLREETEEFSEAVAQWEAGDPAKEKALCDELSDLLLQVLFHAEIANRRGAFDIGHVAGAFVQKMRSRAPYLFEAEERQVSIEEQERCWAAGKEREAQDTE